METNETTIQPVYPKPSGVFGTKIPSSIAFAIGVLLFFLPFIDIKCNNMSLQKVNGVELATGFHIKGPDSNDSFAGTFENSTDNNKLKKKEDRKDPNVFALAALVLGVAGFLLSMLNNKAGAGGGLVTGALATVAMIGLLIDIKADINDQLLGKEPDISIAVEFTAWFFLSLLSFLAAAYFSYRRWKQANTPTI